MINKFNIGDLDTSNRFLGLGIITDKLYRAADEDEVVPDWYYFVHFENGDAHWLHERALMLEIKV